MTRVLVTGGAGFIGSHVVDRFVSAGCEVAVIDDLSSGLREQVAESATLHELDIRSSQVVEVVRAFRPEILIHTAAQMSVRISMERPTFDTDVNVTGLVNVLHAFEGLPKPHVVFTSTGGAIYGEQDLFPADEDHPIRPTSIYGLSKRVGEMYLDFYRREKGFTFAALRLANVYGPRQNPHGEAGVVAIFCERMLTGETPTINGNGEQTRDFIFVGDVADAIFSAGHQKVSGIFNIGTGREASVNDIFRHINNALGAGMRPQYGPAKAGEQLRSCISAERAHKAFSFTPRMQLEQGLRETAQWFSQKIQTTRLRKAVR